MPEFRRIMGFGEGIYQALTGKSPRSAERQNTQQKAQELMKRHGSTRRVAEIVGASQRTVQRWLKGTQEAKRSNTKAALDSAQRAARITPGRASKFAGSARAPEAGAAGAGGLSIYGEIKVSDDIRWRWIHPGTKIPAGALDNLAEIVARQGPEAAAAQVNNLISTHYVPGMRVLQVEAIEFD
jgi:transcriptional regulator with XRE-family HTH domain